MRRQWFLRIGVVCLCFAVPFAMWLAVNRLTSSALVPQASDELSQSSPPVSAPPTDASRPSPPASSSATEPTPPRPTPAARTSVTIEPAPTRTAPRRPRPTPTRVDSSSARPPTRTPVITTTRPSPTTTTRTPTQRPPTPTPSPTRTPKPSPTPAPDDRTPPSKVTGLRVVGVDDRTYTVAWEPAVDNIVVARYIADVNGERHVVTGTQFTGVLPVSATTLFVQVRAEDAAGNEGRWSDQLIVELTVPTPDPELTPPPLSGPPNEHAGQQNPH